MTFTTVYCIQIHNMEELYKSCRLCLIFYRFASCILYTSPRKRCLAISAEAILLNEFPIVRVLIAYSFYRPFSSCTLQRRQEAYAAAQQMKMSAPLYSWNGSCWETVHSPPLPNATHVPHHMRPPQPPMPPPSSHPPPSRPRRKIEPLR